MRFQSENGRIGDQPVLERLEQDKQRLREWRQSKRPGEQIPEQFWQMALSYLGTLPLSRISRELSLDYVKLKRLAGSEGSLPKEEADPTDSVPRFIELPWLRLARTGEGSSGPRERPSLVLERRDGSRLRIEGLLPEISYVEALVAAFCRE